MRKELQSVATHLAGVIRYNAEQSQYNGHNSRFSIPANARVLISDVNVSAILTAYKQAVDSGNAEYVPNRADTALLSAVLKNYPTWGGVSNRSLYLQLVDVILYEAYYSAKRGEIAPEFALPKTKSFGTTRAGTELAMPSMQQQSTAKKAVQRTIATVRATSNKFMNNAGQPESNDNIVGSLIVVGVGGGVAFGSYKLLQNKASYKGDDNFGKRLVVSGIVGVLAGGITHLVATNVLNSQAQTPPSSEIRA